MKFKKPVKKTCSIIEICGWRNRLELIGIALFAKKDYVVIGDCVQVSDKVVDRILEELNLKGGEK